MRQAHVACLVIAGVGAFVAGAKADEIEVLGTGNYIFRYDTRTGEVTRFAKVGGLLEGERLSVIESGNGHLYGVTDERVYVIDPITRNATPAGPRIDDLQFELGLPGYRMFAFDIPSGSDAASVLIGTSAPGAGPVTGTRSLTFDVNTLLTSDHATGTGGSLQLVYAQDDPGFGTSPVVRAATHRPDPQGSGKTEFIGIDVARNVVVRIGPLDGDPLTAEGNVVRTLAPLTGLDQGDSIVTMDMSIDGPLLTTPLVLAQSATPLVTPVYSLDTGTGVLTKLPDMGTRLAIDISAPPAWTIAPTHELDLTRFTAAVDLSARGRSSATFVGKIEVPFGGWEGKRLRVDFGGVTREFQLDGRGRGTSGGDTFKVSRKPKNGSWYFTLQLRRGDFRTLGVGGDPPTGTVPVVIDLFVDDAATDPVFRDVTAYRTQFDVDFYVNRSGRAVLSRHAP